MHIAPLIRIPHTAGPDGWIDAMDRLAAALAEHPHLTITVRLPGAALDHVRQREVWEKIPTDRIGWLAGGFSDPILTRLPPDAQRQQLTREAAIMDTARIVPLGLWLDDSWEPGLVDLALGAGHSVVYLDRALVPGADRPAAIERAGQVVVGVPVSNRLIHPVDDPDALVTLLVEPEDLGKLVERFPGCLTRPDLYLSEHLPGPRVEPTVNSPGIHPNAEVLYRKLLLLISDQRGRTGGMDATLRLQSREHLEDPRPETIEELLATRISVDAERRGDTWVTITDGDWDADGLPETRIETAHASLLIDPTDATVVWWDDKVNRWPITGVLRPQSGYLIRTLTADDSESPPKPLRLEGRTEGKGSATLTLEGSGETRCRVELAGSALTIEVSVELPQPMRVGPEIPLNMDSVEVRTDGGPWLEADSPLALTGHRYRLTDRTRTLLVVTPRPSQLFITPVPEGGYLLWPHWLIAEGGSYRVSFTPS